jgi:hypothetical protein
MQPLLKFSLLKNSGVPSTSATSLWAASAWR